VEQYYNYDREKYPFVKLVTNLFDCNLQELHRSKEVKYDFFDRPGKDSDTIFHQTFYDAMRAGWLDFEETYKNFIRDEISQIIGIDDKIVFQKWPSFRVHLPGNVAVGGWHRDFDYNHPEGEINFILAITPMFESNTTISESEPGKMDFRQFTLNPGQIVKFNGNKCIHGNLPNTTGKTRVSLDFRVMKYENYNNSHLLTSLSKNNKFLIGDYYDIITQ